MDVAAGHQDGRRIGGNHVLGREAKYVERGSAGPELGRPDPLDASGGVLVQRELDKSTSQLRESLAFGKEVFSGMREFWITIGGDRVGRAA